MKQNYDLFISFSGSDKRYKFEGGQTIKIIDTFKKYLEDHKHPRIKNKRFTVCTYTEDFELAPTVSQAIRNKLMQSNALLVFCSHSSSESSYVQEELRYFKEELKKEIIPANYLLTPNDAFPEKFDLDALGVNLAPAPTLKAWKKQARLESHKLVAKIWQLPLTDTYNRFVRRDRLRKRNLLIVSFSVILALVIAGAFFLNERYKRTMRSELEQHIISSGGEIETLANGNIELDFRSFENIKDNDLESLKYLGNIVSIYLPFDNEITDKGISNLKNLKGTTTLAINSTVLTGNGLRSLSELTKLKQLSLTGCKLIRHDLKNLRHFPSMNNLSISGCTIDELDLEYLNDLNNLEYLNLASTKISDQGLKKLQDLTTIKFLSLYAANITDSGIAILANLKSLEDLELFYTSIGDDAIPHLLKLSKLKRLAIAHTHISVEGVEQLTTLNNIEKVVIHDDQYTNEEYQKLRKLFDSKGITLWSVDF